MYFYKGKKLPSESNKPNQKWSTLVKYSVQNRMLMKYFVEYGMYLMNNAYYNVITY